MTLVKNVPKFTPATQSDLAFQGDYAYAGTYDGLRVIDISDPASAHQVAFFRCPGSQFDVSVWGDLAFASVDSPRSDPGCNSTAAQGGASNPNAWEGIRVFDISDPTDPTYVKSIRTDCGSHTHTLVPAARNSLFIYVSSYGLTTSSLGPHCEQFHGKISVIHVNLKNPEKAAVVATPAVDVPVFDHTRVELGSAGLNDTTGCHDITVLKPLKLAAAACLSVGQLWDISDITAPRRLLQFDTPDVRAWHSAQFTQDGSRIAFGDEAGGGALGRCREQDYPNTGAVWIYDRATGATLGNYKLPRFFGEEDHCTMHNFNFVPESTATSSCRPLTTAARPWPT
jgi:hypothetical protein